MGDFVSHTLHLGHWRGLGPLALIFAVILLAERRSGRESPPPSRRGEAYYWLAIVTLRTAATNLGDLATHDFRLTYPVVIAALAALLAALVFVARRQTGADPVPEGVPVTNTGTLGTVGGDATSDALGLGAGWGSLVLIAILAAMLAWRAAPGGAGLVTYWLTVTAVRTAGTTVGDFTAFRHGLDLGLPLSTAVTGVLLAGVLLACMRGFK
jgi:uncharacterized membrane-anchored protein